jgi:DNA polymerase-3 subunit epsilon
MYLFFDTETNGKAKNSNGAYQDIDNWPRVTQLAFITCDENGNLQNSGAFLIKPNGWTIPNEAFFIENNMSTERCEAHGVRLETALSIFLEQLNACNFLIAHNMSFDHPVLCAEFIRLGWRSTGKFEKVCTMKTSTDLCKIPGARGYKWPKLEELHQFLFNEGFDGAHDALNDVKATAKCFFEMKRRGVLEPKQAAPSINVPSVNDL